MDTRLNPGLAWLFDLDGVLPPTADWHRLAWSRLFGELFAQHPHTPAYSELALR